MAKLRPGFVLALLPVLSACASGHSPAARSGSAPNDAVGAPPPTLASASSPASTAGLEAGDPKSAPSARPTPPPPPLSSPNAVVERADAGAMADAAASPSDDPETRALRSLALAAQECHAREAPAARGKLMLRLTLAADGRVRTAEVVRDTTDVALAAQGFVGCVLQASRKQRFPAPSGEDSQLELPLLFDPVQ